ncbi:uncharacterized protein LOC133554370 isoform X4 [Nerophis ophidion]|uniref:uncharacterized protein LOC133554370 isoform X4 n=1 Tax=Nerophis ophidion TaxID=159077 RepID=UPI002AE0A437|nr:uncharacterized protein LOC133554370 isoform X4 [Nerophis ophidion]
MCEKTIAEYEEELCPTKEEKEPQRQLLDAVFKKHQVVLNRTVLCAEMVQGPNLSSPTLVKGGSKSTCPNCAFSEVSALIGHLYVVVSYQQGRYVFVFGSCLLIKSDLQLSAILDRQDPNS